MFIYLVFLFIIISITITIYYYSIEDNIKTYNSTYLFITSYFFVKRNKHSNSEFKDWMNNFFSLINESLIIFTDYYSVKYIPPNKGKYILYKTVFDIPCVSKYRNIYYKQNNIDPEKCKNHSAELYAVWNSKICVLKKASELYNRSVYIWIDIGSSRWKHNYKKFPDVKVINYLSNLNSMFFFAVYNRRFKKEKVKQLITEDFLEGGTFGGNKRSIDEYYDIFWKVHDEFLNKGEFVGKDQSIYNTIAVYYLQNITIFPSYGFYKCFESDQWFRFYKFYAAYKCMMNKGEKINKYIC